MKRTDALKLFLIAVLLAIVLALLVAILGTAPLAADAQEAGKVYRIGILGDKASDSNEILLWQTFRAGLRERGWNEGVNIRIEYVPPSRRAKSEWL